MNLAISPKIQSVTPSAALSFNERVVALQKSGRKVYHFGFGESRLPIHQKLVNSLAKFADKTSYEPVGGIAELKKAATNYWNKKFSTSFNPDLTFIGTGSKILFHDVLRIIDGDLILPRPTWVSYEPQATMLGKKVIWVDTQWSNNCIPTGEDIDRAILNARSKGMNPRILLVTNPGNPTGVQYSDENIREISEICRKHNIIVISDEIYALIDHGDTPQICFAKYLPEATIITSGLSKAFSLGGWRLGFAFLPDNELGKTLYHYMGVVAGSSWSIASAPIQYASVSALTMDSEIEEYLSNCNKIHTLVTHYLFRKLTSLGIRVLKPQGGFYLYLDFSNEKKLSDLNIKTSEDLANYLLENYSIAALHGTVFGEDPSTFSLRLATSYIYTPNQETATEVYNSFSSKPFDPLDIELSEEFILKSCPVINEALDNFKLFCNSLK